MTTLFVTDEALPVEQTTLKTISFKNYLHDYPKLGEPKMRIINLCDTQRYLSAGYYCSLLAEARQHQVLPTIKVINDLRENGSNLWLETLATGKEIDIEPGTTLLICMGEVADSRYKKLAYKLFNEFPAPLLSMTVVEEASALKIQLSNTSLSELSEEQTAFCWRVLEDYSQKTWAKKGASKKYRWEVAMLVDKDEAVPPSDKGALKRFVRAAEKLGIHLQPLEAAELYRLNQFDGLFIRETTAIDHHTYRLASKAEELGMVVIDDPNSILRCCNKVFLHDAFNYRKVPSLKTLILSDISPDTVDKVEAQFTYPLVLKMPEGSFSRGVFKVTTRDELQEVANKLLADSALVLAQEYLFTEFDWRIGIFNNRAIYACRYFMARNHWQIYNHGSKRFFSGGFDTLPTFEVPRVVLEAAMKSAAVVGDGLYGIDIKELDGKAYVLEVNDNPSIDHGVEDKYLGEELYMQIMSEFLRRLELRGQ
nr:RimK family protein [Halioxenophilus sp. WMMB6]